MTRLAIIADDLSSATDCGAQMVRSGLSVVVPLGGYSLPSDAGATDVISIDTDSRSLTAEQAYAKVKSAAQQLVTQGSTHFYKSIDSTLRGNLGAEIEAVMEVVRPDCAIIAPAFPKYGRTTINGVQYLHGRPLHETEFGTDPTSPVKDADLARRLALGSPRNAGRLALDQVRGGPEVIQSALHDLLDEGVEFVIVDVSEQEDLQRICIGLSRSEQRIVWIGSTGLAEFIPLTLNGSSASAMVHQTHQVDARPSLALVGSASETTRQQLEYALTHHGLKIIDIDAAGLIQEGAVGSQEFEEATKNLRSAIRANQDAALVVRAARAEIAATQELGASLGLSPTQVAQRIVDGLAHAAHQLIQESEISGVVATGGDTANAICNRLGAKALEILGEVEAGIPIMRILGPQSLPLVTKAGGFGSPAAIQDALVKVKQYV